MTHARTHTVSIWFRKWNKKYIWKLSVYCSLLLSIVSSRFRSQLNSVMPFLIPNKPKWLNLSSNIASLALSFSNLWNNSFFANSYNSMSRAFNCSTFSRCSACKCFNVELDTVELCWSNGMAKRKLNVSSNTYWEIWNETGKIVCVRQRRIPFISNDLMFLALLFDIRWARSRTWPLNFVLHWPTWCDHVCDWTWTFYCSSQSMLNRTTFWSDDSLPNYFRMPQIRRDPRPANFHLFNGIKYHN